MPAASAAGGSNVARYFGSGRGLKRAIGAGQQMPASVARYFGSGRGLKLPALVAPALDDLSPAISVVGVD